MPLGSSADLSANHDPSPGPDDQFLIAGTVGGDAAALRKLMDRSDRLVRYAIFRAGKEHCQRDPQWLDSIASETWTGFVRSIRRDPDNPPNALGAFLVQVARNRAISAIRRLTTSSRRETTEIEGDPADIPASLDDPAEELARLEQLEALRACLGQLDAAGQRLATQIEAITERRWRAAAAALGLKESTLRSRWKQVLQQLHSCIKQKTAKNFAPSGVGSDYLDEDGVSVREGSRR